MAVQTKIQHRRDTAANWTSTNPTLASGEIGFETDTLKFKVGNGSTAWNSLKYSQDASLLSGTASITALSTTGDVNASGYLRSFNSSGDEGGEIFLSKPVTNTNVNTGVTIDVYQDKLRFFEQGGSARGYYIDISLGGAGASTNLAGGGSAFNGGTITGSLTVSNTIGISTSGQYTSTLAQGTAPFVVSSNTIVTNLNADLLDGYNTSTTTAANTVVVRDANGSIAANVITANIALANVTGLGTNVATFLGTPNSLNLLNAVTNETGTGSLVFATSPTLTTPNIGAATGTSLNVTGQLISTQASGTAPFAVSSNTVVTNLNADLLDGYSANEGAVASTVVARTSSGAINANVIFGTAIDASSSVSAAQGVLVGTEGVSAQPVIGIGRTDSAASTPTINFNSGATTTTYDAQISTSGGNGTDGKGTLTITAGNVNVTSQIRSTFAGAPFAVANTTVVTNLNADLLDGYHHATAATANTVVARDANGSFSANVITASLSGRATNANSIVGGGAGQLPYQSAANTTTFLAAAGTNNSFLIYNTSTSAPEWDTPPQAMAALMGYTSTVTAAGSTTLTNTSSYYQYFTGTSTQTVVLPVTSTLQTGWTFHIVNNSTGNVTVNSSGGNAVIVIPAGVTAMITCIGTTLTTAADWEAGLTDFSTYTGSGAVVMNNTPTFTTPNIGAATGTSLNVTGGLFSTGDSNIGGTTTTNVRIMTRRIWISNTAPTGTNTTGDVWISW